MSAFVTDNVIVEVEADSAMTNYPASNVLDDHPKKVWKAPASDFRVEMLITVSGAVDVFGLFNVTADEVEVSVTDSNAIEWPDITWDNVAWLSTEGDLETVYSSQEYNTAKAIWVEVPNVPASGFTIKVVLRKNAWNYGDELGFGVLQPGTLLELPRFVKGLEETLIDHSITKELNNGSVYYKKRDTVREFSGQVVDERDDDYYDFFLKFARNQGARPTGWWLASDMGEEWIIYGRLQEMPKSSYSLANKANMNLKIREVF